MKAVYTHMPRCLIGLNRLIVPTHLFPGSFNDGRSWIIQYYIGGNQGLLTNRLSPQ